MNESDQELLTRLMEKLQKEKEQRDHCFDNIREILNQLNKGNVVSSERNGDILYKSYRPHKVATEIIFKFTEDAIAPIKMTWQRGEETLLKSEVEK